MNSVIYLKGIRISHNIEFTLVATNKGPKDSNSSRTGVEFSVDIKHLKSSVNRRRLCTVALFILPSTDGICSGEFSASMPLCLSE